MRVLLINVDSVIPNLALMRLSAWHKAQGNSVYLNFGPCPDFVYASSVFDFSRQRQERLRAFFPQIVEGGTGYAGNWRTLDSALGENAEAISPDYSLWPEYPHSIGFTARGCRLACKFCVVPQKEGKPVAVHSIFEIWRGEPFPRNILLLDNDFFGQPEHLWRARLAELKEGKFKVCLNQGINVRMITEESATALASVDYRDDGFKEKRLYTAWDNLKDEGRFKNGIRLLAEAGIAPRHVLVYMLIGYAPDETEAEILYRHDEIQALGCKPYPMVYDRSRPELKAFARWVIRGYSQRRASRDGQPLVPWPAYRERRFNRDQLRLPCP